MPISPVQYPIFQPAMREIAAITNSSPAIVTTTFNHNYLTGLIVRLDLPLHYGMMQINGQQGMITRLNATQFSFPVDTTRYDVFVIPAGTQQGAQVVPIGENTLQVDQATRNVLPNNILP